MNPFRELWECRSLRNGGFFAFIISSNLSSREHSVNISMYLRLKLGLMILIFPAITNSAYKSPISFESMVIFVIALRFGKSSAFVHISIPVEVLLRVESISVFSPVTITWNNAHSYRWELGGGSSQFHPSKRDSAESHCSLSFAFGCVGICRFIWKWGSIWSLGA